MGIGHDEEVEQMEHIQALYDTGCSFIILSEAEARRRCRGLGREWDRFLEPYPSEVNTPTARTAKAGQSIKGLGLVPITLEFVVHRHREHPNVPLQITANDILMDPEHDKKMPDHQRSPLFNCDWEVDKVRIQTYAHVFHGVATPLLLGTPFKRQYVVHDQGQQLGVLLPVSYTHLTLPTKA